VSGLLINIRCVAPDVEVVNGRLQRQG
jgi:hypothetical protein